MRNFLWIATLGLVLATRHLGNAQESGAEIVETKLPTYTAEVVKLDGDGLTIKLSGQSRLLAIDQLLRVRLPASSEPPVKSGMLVELSDGSQISCRQITSDGKSLTLELADGTRLSVPTRQVASCLQHPLDSALARQWETMVESRATSDILILQRSPESLDKIEGVIGAINDAQVKFQFDGQDIDVQRSKLAGWRFFSAAPPTKEKLLAVVRDKFGSSWMASSAMVNWTRDEQVELMLVGGTKLSLPLKTITEFDFSFSSMRFLADIEPLERKVQPRLSLAIQLPEVDKLFGPRPSPPESSRGVAAGPGIQFMGSGFVTYRVPGEFKRLLGSVVLAPEGPQFVPCKVQVFQEDKLLWEKTLTEPHQPQAVELDVEPGRRLRLIVQADSKQPIGDLVNWRQLRFVK